MDKDYRSVSASELNGVRKAYESAGIELEAKHFNSEAEIIAGCQDAFAILATGNSPITRDVMAPFSPLKFVQRCGVGVNSIDLDATTELGKIILNLPGFCPNELANLVIATIMGLIHNTTCYDQEIRKGACPNAGRCK